MSVPRIKPSNDFRNPKYLQLYFVLSLLKEQWPQTVLDIWILKDIICILLIWFFVYLFYLIFDGKWSVGVVEKVVSRSLEQRKRLIWELKIIRYAWPRPIRRLGWYVSNQRPWFEIFSFLIGEFHKNEQKKKNSRAKKKITKD